MNLNINVELRREQLDPVMWALRDAAVTAATHLRELENTITPEMLDQLEASGAINGYEADVDMAQACVTGCVRMLRALCSEPGYGHLQYLAQIDKALHGELALEAEIGG